ncbi:MAG: hypothetical protein ACK4WH_01540 [Phycisphaerales bacterium]
MSKRAFAAAAAVVVAAGSAIAGVQTVGIDNQNIFGHFYGVSIFRVANDLLPVGPQLQPEGMVFHDGVLYVSGDGGAVSTPSEANGYIAAYPMGNIGSMPTPVGQFAVSGRAIGPEGIAINTRGSGYGSFSGSTPNFVAVDNAGGSVGRILGVLNPAGPSVDDIQSGFLNTDDIAFVPGATAADDRFAIIDGGSIPPSLKWYDTGATPSLLTGGFNLVPQAKGLLFLPASDAALFSPNATGDALLVAVSPDFAGDTNKLLLYSLDGALLDTAILPSGTGPGLLGNIEALAFDPVARRLFIGDETGGNSQIAVLTIPSPGAAGLLSLGLLASLRRRR